MNATTICTQHTICDSSDSNLPICKCWCADCRETIADTINMDLHIVTVK